MSTNNIVNPPLQLFFMNNTAITLIIIVLLFLKKSQLPNGLLGSRCVINILSLSQDMN